ncbi:MAG: DUF1656 domain-containing protein [Desulfuromonadales bacterium]|nr:DUF1656 domain-containing protein [Desulfuromonadales bacterium]
MSREVEFLGTLMPGLLPVFLISIVLQIILDRIMGKIGIYRYVWHPPLFRLSIFVSIFAAVGLMIYR